MTDRNEKELKQGDTIKQIIGDALTPKGTLWKVVDFGFERNGKKVCIIKSVERGYIMSAYQSELFYFEKVGD